MARLIIHRDFGHYSCFSFGIKTLRALEVLHVSNSDIEGGSARSAWRIHTGVAALGARSRMLVGWKSSDSPDVATVSGSRMLQLVDKVTNIFTQKVGLQYRFVPSRPRLARHPWVRSADIIQLYNIHGGYFDPAILPALSDKAPLVWRMSDLWPITGHCAYPGPCERWRSGCGSCPDLATYPPIGIDTTAALWKRKQRLYERSRITVVAPSSWTEEAARRSPLFGQFRIERIPNGIDTTRFAPNDRQAARKQLGIVDDRPAILFCAHVAFDNSRKGTDLLEGALNRVSDPSSVCLIVAGKGSEQWVGRTPVATHPLSFTTDEDRLTAIYAACDVVAVPSAVENLPNTALEAMSSGRPIVAVDAGGMADAVVDGETGFLVPPGGVAELAEALHRVIYDRGLHAGLAVRGRALVERKFSQEAEAARFMALYTDLADARQ